MGGEPQAPNSRLPPSPTLPRKGGRGPTAPCGSTVAQRRMTFPDITPDLKAAMPDLRGRLLANQSLAELTWFRVGGPAQVLFTPADEADLAYFLAHLPQDIPVYVVGVGSNLIVRDGGLPGVVIRSARAALAKPAPVKISSTPVRRRSTSAWPRLRRRQILAGWNSSSAFPAPLAARCA